VAYILHRSPLGMPGLQSLVYFILFFISSQSHLGLTSINPEQEITFSFFLEEIAKIDHFLANYEYFYFVNNAIIIVSVLLNFIIMVFYNEEKYVLG